MYKKMAPLVAAIVFAGGIAAGSAGFAADAPTANPAPQGQGMMGGQKGQDMMGGNGDMMGAMTRMMNSCSSMMESANKPAAPATPAPNPRG